ncbi:hypothetical protein [Microbacterium sp. NPDC058389]|uniref:hypothetical protein n=1 Tax=Microbacterium sp. NPDC058389 TaxID=3346475 RepID=UPI00364B32A6
MVEFELALDGTCTTDSNPTTHTFSAEQVGPELPDTVKIVFPQLDDEVTVELLDR